MSKILAALATLAALAAPSWAESSPLPAFKILVEREAVYRLTFDDLAATGLTEDLLTEALPSAGLGVENGGRPVPVWVEDGGDGVFGPGDRLELVGERLAGDHSWASEHSRYNVYSLRFDHPSPRRMQPLAAATDAAPRRAAPLRRHQHLEEDLLILRLRPAKDGGPEELWYWAKLVHNQKQPFAATLDLHDLEPAAGNTVDLAVQLRGWSKPRSKPEGTADHRVEVLLDGEEIGAAEWDGTRPYRLEVPGLAADRLTRGQSSLAFKVPKRVGDAQGRALIDVVMLNWIEITYPRQRQVGDEQAHFTLAPGTEDSSPPSVVLESDPGRELVLYGEAGSRTVSAGSGLPAVTDGEPKGHRHVFLPAPGERTFFAASPAALLAPDAVVRDQPSRLANTDNRADYVMIAHPTLLAATLPLAEFHRSRGLEVMVADVEDVYDEFSHGVVHPRALRDFLDHATHRWQSPPRFVLLVGDASWDGKNENTADLNYADWTYRPGETRHFGKNQSTPYPEEPEVNRRGLIPTWNHTTYEGHSASDNYFVAVDGDDFLPDLAIGRLPVVKPEEVERIVAKTVRYAASPEVGPWRRSALFITNESRGFQRQSDALALGLSTAGFAPEKVYPASTETSNEHHTRKLIETFDRGQLFVHFLGHGGRYIWRTGPPDLKKNHDLFTLDHLQQLSPTERLPVVLSLTCYSAPFDHPSADSIGEKLLRIGERGAVAVFAASWRNSPSPQWGKVLLEELTAPGATVGEAVTAAKRRLKSRIFVETYNLLGDPAVPVALPAAGIELRAVEDETGIRPLEVHGTVGVPGFAGRLLVDLVGAGGEALSTLELEIDAPDFTAELEVGGEELAAARVVRAYAWDASRGVDAVGAVKLVREEPEPPGGPRRRGPRSGSTR